MFCTTRIRRLLCTHKPASFFVTTPIFYVNAAPHIGHLYSAVVADAIHRYVKLRNNRVNTKFSTGTDEHGTKIQQAANLNKVPVDEYCSKISSLYKETFQAAGVEYSDFIRTTEQRHKDAVAHFWNSLKSKGHIYSAEYKGWYCVSDEMFLTESQLKTNPDGSKVSAESGHPVEWTQEVNYMFALSAFQNDVVNWVKSGGRIRPLKFEKILLNYLEEPLPDISVSRPSSRVHWGIRVPGDNTQSIYVWLDALVNYLTCVGYPGREHSNQWPPALQVIGKDILKFHGIYWPAFLIAAGLEPPQKLLVHSHWTVDEQKMSKSKFNVVDPNQRAELYTMEGLRYFLLREGVPHSDGNYSDVKVLRILNAELADTLGNLLSRSCAKTLNPRQVFPKISDNHFQELCEMDATKRLIEAVNQLPDKCAEHYDSYNFYLAIDQIMAALHAANNFFEACRPWELRKRSQQRKTPPKSPSMEGGNNLLLPSDEDVLKLETIISVTMDTLRKCAIILQPIVPNMSRKLLDKLAVPLEERSWDNLSSSVWRSDSKFSERDLDSTDAVLFRRILQEGEKAKIKRKS